jgi:hypothetical protein
MKRSTKFLLPFIVLVVLVVFSLFLAFLGGYQKVDHLATHHKVQPSEFNRKFQPSELKADLEFLAKTLEDVHLDLYAYTPKSVISKEKERIKAELNSPMSRSEFYLKVAPLVASLREGHTKIYPPWEEYHHFISKGGLLFPFDLDLKDHKAFIALNYSSDSLAVKGSELLSINGISIEEVADSLLLLISGEKLNFRLGYLEDFFGQLLWLVYKFEKEFEIEFTSKSDGKRYVRSIAGVDYNTIQTKKERDLKESEGDYYTYHSLSDEKVGIIDFSQFINLEEFKKFLLETFTRVQEEGITDLIIDIRENGGGYSELVDPLLSYITDKPVVGGLHFEIKVSKQIKDYNRSTLRWYVKWLPIQYIHPTWRKMWNTPEGDIAVIRHQPEKAKDNPLRFNGQVYLLIGPHTYSTAQGFAAMVQDYELGTLIGEETGGVASSFGAWYPFDLPNTRLWVFVSTKRILRPSGVCDGRGVVPDYEVKQSEKDLKEGIDRVMEFTKELIKLKGDKT